MEAEIVEIYGTNSLFQGYPYKHTYYHETKTET